jgi:hypothetical protein
VLHEESNPTTSRLVCVSDAEEIIDDRIDILRLGRCFVDARVCHRRKLYISFVLAGLGFVPTHAYVATDSGGLTSTTTRTVIIAANDNQASTTPANDNQASTTSVSQTKLADVLGLTFQQVQKYDKGTNRIGGSRLQHISQILQVPAAFFFEGVAAKETPYNTASTTCRQSTF